MHSTTTIDRPDPAGHVLRDDELAAYVLAVAEEGERFATVADAGELDVPIASCPGWDMRELVEHVGMVHLWAAANIRFPSDRWLSVDELSDLEPYWPDHTRGRPDDAGLVGWYRSTLTILIEVLGSTPTDHRCLTFLPATSPLVMWARRQANEIAVHRYDAAAARGCPAHFDARFAADMLDELLSGFAPRMRPPDATPDRTMHVVADDVGDDYVVTMGPSGIRTQRGGGPIGERNGGRHDLRLSGSAADLSILLWNRPPGPSIRLDGDERVLDLWSETCRVQWL